MRSSTDGTVTYLAIILMDALCSSLGQEKEKRKERELSNTHLRCVLSKNKTKMENNGIECCNHDYI